MSNFEVVATLSFPMIWLCIVSIVEVIERAKLNARVKRLESTIDALLGKRKGEE